MKADRQAIEQLSSGRAVMGLIRKKYFNQVILVGLWCLRRYDRLLVADGDGVLAAGTVHYDRGAAVESKRGSLPRNRRC